MLTGSCMGFWFLLWDAECVYKRELHPNLCGFTLRQVLGQPHHVPLLFTPSVTSVSYLYRNVQCSQTSPLVNVLKLQIMVI